MCLEAADLNDDGGVNIADPVYELAFPFGSGTPPAAPHPGCGPDTDGDAVPCDLSMPGCP